MSDERRTPTDYRWARQVAALLLILVVVVLLVLDVIVAEYEVRPSVLVPLLLTVAGLLSVDLERQREEASQRLAKTRDIGAWQATMLRLDAEAEVARTPRQDRRMAPAEVVAYLRSLPAIWAASGPEGRRALATALFATIQVEGYKTMEYTLTPEATDLGLSGSLPAILEVGAQIGEFGRGERI